jgi:hypothetical protein
MVTWWRWIMNGYGRRGYPMPQGGAGYNPYSKYPNFAGIAQQFIQNMMMMKQMKQQKEQQKWQREQAEESMKYKRLGMNLQLKETAAKIRERELAPRIEAREEAEREKLIGKLPKGAQPWVRLGIRPPTTKPIEPGITKQRKTWLDKLDKDIDGMIKNITAMPAYGMDEELGTQIGHLQEAKTKVRGALAIGADMSLPDALWKELRGISGRLKEIEKKGLYPPKPKPLLKGKLPRMKRSELPAGTEIKWNPKLGLRMAKVKDKWYWIIE